MATYAISGACAALAGVIIVSQVGLAVPYLGSGYELDTIAAAVVGGVALTGGAGSVLVGALGFIFIGVLLNGMALVNVPAIWQMVIQGIVIISAVALTARRARERSNGKGDDVQGFILPANAPIVARARQDRRGARRLRRSFGADLRAGGFRGALSHRQRTGRVDDRDARCRPHHFDGNGRPRARDPRHNVRRADADADVGYGSLLNVRRAIRELEAAGASAIQLEDQASPKKCGHEPGRNVVSITEMSQRLNAACEGRRNYETLIIARTDARTTLGLPEAISRGRAYAKAGADIIFVSSPETEAELREVASSLDVPTLANMVETGRTPYLSAQALGEMGFAVAIYPASGFLAATHAVRATMDQLKRFGRVEDMSGLASLAEYHKILGFDAYAELETTLGQTGG